MIYLREMSLHSNMDYKYIIKYYLLNITLHVADRLELDDL